MAAAGIVDARTNPNDPSQRVELWGNGRIDTFNTAPITDGPSTWYTRLDLPVAVAIWIINWTTMAGYVLDKQGGFHPFGGAPSIGVPSNVNDAHTHEVVVGVPYWPTGIYKDWSWDPNTPGRGVVLDGFGTLHPFGGAPNPPRAGFRWPILAGRKLVMQWTPDVRAYTLDYAGGVHHDYAAVAAPGYSRILAAQPPLAGDIPYWKLTDMARDLVITDWVGTPGGYTMNKYGQVLAWGGAEPAIGYPRNTGGDWARKLLLLNADNPLRFRLIGAAGQSHEWVASTPPTVTAGGFTGTPATTVDNTSRPVLTWAYTDAQQDSQAEARVLVFTAAFVASHTMTDPLAHAASAVVDVSTTDPDTRGIASPVDLENGSYRMYVRARDTADQWSAWSNRSWTQNVPVPATPTGLTATANADATVALSVSAATGGVATLVRFDRSDDYNPQAPAAATWMPVHGADALPIAATTTAVDRFPRQGKTPAYRAVAYSIDPRTASLPSAVDTAEVPIVGHLLHATDDPTLGGRIKVQNVDWVRTSTAGVFEGLDADYPTVVKDGSRPRAARANLELMTMDAAAWALFEELALSRSTLVHRGPFGDVRYCEIVGDWGQAQVRAAPMKSEATPLRHMHTTSPHLVEVRPPHLPA